MNKKILLNTGIIIAFLFGCANTNQDENAQDNNVETQPLHYETNEEQKDRQGVKKESVGEKGGYKQSDQKGTNASERNSGNYTDIFTNEETKEIYRHVTGLKEVKNAQIASTEEKVIVAVMLNEHSNHNVQAVIEQEVKKFAPDKTIVVYTDDIYWDRMSNLKSRLKAGNGGNEFQEQMEKFFNRDND
ncbi:YhcN/YlaJ family sporulation lipoprotein [Virgibacillus ndiopensis]|uniref:YhcN/YlaJ family sporulation lipoprotein n=1 Tax=Virgibacillus ndiopensis TaxID=2004408 RepID=UPI000C088696|nr:YhcN/YlaJ family sporulation lipoprotein [Virgibacillus ndiopensis]